MQYIDHRTHLHVEMETKECDLPLDQRARLQDYLNEVEEAVGGFPQSDLRLTIVFHPRSEVFRAEAKLKLPGKTISAADSDPHLDSALQHCVHKLIHKVDAYKANPDHEAVELAERQAALQRDVIAPKDVDAGQLGQAFEQRDYGAFRQALEDHEEWLRRRVGRWVQRYSDAQERVGGGLRIGDIVEEVFLNAFERYDERPMHKPLLTWLEELIDPSLKDLLEHPDEVRENASLARTRRSTRLPR